MFFKYSGSVIRTRIALRTLLVGALFLPAIPAYAADEATADAAARVIDSTRLLNVEALQFGQIVPSGSGGAVMINANTGNVTTIGEVVTIASTQTRARFTVDAPIGVVMILSGDPSVELTRVGGTETMTASLIHRPTSGLVTLTLFGLPIGLLATSPTQEIHTGGSLVVAGNQAEGVYEGTFTLMIAYL
ncbi:MAG: DUF4402 domain-containing protein [Allopontixanthobacter sediminis]